MTAVVPTPVTARVRWAIVCFAAFAAAAAALELHGRSSRRVLATGAPGPGRWAAVPDAAGAFRVWRSLGMNGRRAVVLTGRWSRPRPRDRATEDGERSPLAVLKPVEAVDVEGALFAAAEDGIARRFDVVMPPGAYAQRVIEVTGSKALVRQDGAFLLPYDALERRFSTPRAFLAPREPVLVLVEPSFFDLGAPEDPSAWLAAQGTRFDLALIALDDPAADDAQRAHARALATSLGAERLGG